MAKKEFMYRGKTLDEIRRLNLTEFAQLIPARQRRSLKKGLTHSQKVLLESIKKDKKKLRTQSRDMVIVPAMLDKTIELHSGNEWKRLLITPYMLGHYLGEFALTRRRVAHNAPGIGATRSSSNLSVK